MQDEQLPGELDGGGEGMGAGTCGELWMSVRCQLEICPVMLARC